MLKIGNVRVLKFKWDINITLLAPQDRDSCRREGGRIVRISSIGHLQQNTLYPARHGHCTYESIGAVNEYMFKANARSIHPNPQPGGV